MMRTFNKMMAPWARRLRLLVTRGVVKRVDDTKGLQALQISALSGELFDIIERLQQYGFTCHPHPGADTINLSVGASRSHTVVIAVDDRRYRLQLAEGEVAIYDDQGQKIVLYRDRIEVEAPKVVVKSDNVQLGADGGAAVARVGDVVTIASGSSAGTWPITSGSAKVSAS